MSLRPKRFSEVFPDECSHLVDALQKTTNHELILCGKCNEPIPTQSREHPTQFCPKCGTGVEKDYKNRNHKSCPNCHLTNENDSLFCRVCGSKLDNNPKTGY